MSYAKALGGLLQTIGIVLTGFCAGVAVVALIVMLVALTAKVSIPAAIFVGGAFIGFVLLIIGLFLEDYGS